MGAISFDPTQFHRDRQAANPANPANSRAIDAALPTGVAIGLARLRIPDIAPADLPDALWGADMIGSSGLASRALGLGWTAIDLFGGPSSINPEWQSLATFAGRWFVTVLDDRLAVARDAGSKRQLWRSAAPSDVKLLWDCMEAEPASAATVGQK